ncbi:MAG: hypothetical protein BWK79_07725 [Beggiatoa sp. IS2]|nr:MAG: hypothetical protein BWK79_07725 [Beggiatoa sp. IS2]
MDIKNEDYSISYDVQATTIRCEGSLRLSGMEEYASLVGLFNQVASLDPPPALIILDLRHLEFLNSSGINVVSKFVIKVRQRQEIKMLVKGANRIAWQGKSLKNLQRLMPNLQLEWE